MKDTLIDLFTVEQEFKDSILNKVFYNVLYTGSEYNPVFIPLRAESAKNTVFNRDYFKEQGTSNDIYIFNYNKPWVSQVYCKNKKPLLYSAEFAIRLKELDSSHTEAVVITQNPNVVEKIAGNFSKLNSVSPTSIEEYALILYISHKLGESKLPPLRIYKVEVSSN